MFAGRKMDNTATDQAVSERIRVGIAGWSYPDWNGSVYKGRIKDKLSYMAGFVDMIEINSTFYRPPDPKTAGKWVERTAAFPGFFFSAKLHQEITHEGRLDEAMVRSFRDGLAPLIAAGRFRHLLAQFKYDFDQTPEHRTHLQKIRNTFDGLGEMVFELRHNSWQSPESLAFLSDLGVTVANIDYPVGRDSFNLDQCLVGREGYFRLHGRNAAAWFDRQAGRDETYDYLYSKGELKGICDRALKLARSFKSLTIVANNHYGGKEVVNALQIKHRLTGQKVKAPPALVGKFPDLAQITAPETNEHCHEEGLLF